MELTVETLPFQEQDHAISACATSALWMALQAAPGFYPHTVPSPHKLTENAHKVFVDSGKSHEVSKGLTVSQMACALKEEKLNPLTCLPFSTSYAKALLRAYLNMGIPVLLGIQLYFRSDDTSTKISRIIGCHSVVALGYECGGIIDAFDSPDMVDSDSENVPELYLEASAITTFYCHDDQIGPYSGMGIPNEYSLGLSSESLPRYIWVVDQFYNDGESKSKVASYFFDATDIENSNFLICAVHYNQVAWAMALMTATQKPETTGAHHYPVTMRRLMDQYHLCAKDRMDYPSNKILIFNS